ncbi:MAG: VOC family protein [Candidatus Cyclobacteriaceae bacterium M3_2C_046]
MEKNVVNWFEIPVNDLSRAKKFYGDLLGLKLQDMQMPGMEMASFPWVQGGENATGALVKSPNHQPSMAGTTVYFSCNDLEKYLELTESLGGKILNPKTSIGEYGFIAHIADSEGNKVALHSVQ